MLNIGIDAGTFSLKVVALNEKNQIIWRGYSHHRNKINNEALKLLDHLEDNEVICLGICGQMGHLLNVNDALVSEEVALSKAMSSFYPQAQSMISIGAQKTFYMEPSIDKEPVLRHNGNCSSGTGAFFEEQAGRLNIELESISDLIDQAHSIPDIAGRCSVFSKTDIIHHMQEGVPTPDLLLGLCYALVRNYKAIILQNRKIKTPVLLCGGVMKNKGVLKALYDQLELTGADVIKDENSDYMPSIGTALMAKKIIKAADLKQLIQKQNRFLSSSDLKPLGQFTDEKDHFEFKTEPVKEEDHYLGIDIGSTSINLVVLNKNKQIIYTCYTRNTGDPLTIVQREIKILKEKYPAIHIHKMAVTGSGREWVAKKLGADLAINEITAQTEGAVLFHPETDTIFEIGGQDSKYMSLDDGQMVDFEMNKVCAAGTGAFLEEQIRKLGISMETFLDYALKSEHPYELGDRCTVFIESSITKALAKGVSMEDVCAGLAYAIASNYLHRVVNLKPIKDHIALQGGIAYNEAVICAFRSLTGKAIHVSPYFSVTGALGAASLCINTKYLEFDKAKNQQLNKQLLKETEASYLDGYDVSIRDPRKKTIGIWWLDLGIYRNK